MISIVHANITEMILSRKMLFSDFNFKPSTWEDVFVVELLRWFDNKIEIMPYRKSESNTHWYYDWRYYYEQIVRILYYFVIYKNIQDSDKLYKIFRYLFNVDKNDNPYRNSYDMISAEKLMKIYNYLLRKVSDYSNKLKHDEDHEYRFYYIAPLINIWNTEKMKIKLGHIKINNYNNEVYIDNDNLIDNNSPKYNFIKNDNEKLELCKEFYNEYKRLPKGNEIYKDYYIGYFIQSLMNGYHSNLKEDVEIIFNTKLFDDDEKLELCKEFYNKYKRLPKSNEIYKDFKIGKFIDYLKYGYNHHLIEDVEIIFNTKIIDDNKTFEFSKVNSLELIV